MRYIISKVKIIVIMVIVVAETNSNGSNIKWSVEVFLESSFSFVFRCFLGSNGIRGKGVWLL